MQNNDSVNAFEVAPYISESLNEADIDHRVLGGIATAAMVQSSLMLPESQLVIPRQEAYISTIRPENDTIRDIDILIMSDDKDQAEEASVIAKNAAVGKLVVSTFGFTPLKNWRGHSVKNTFKDWTSKRLIDEGGMMYYAAHPFSTPVEESSYEPWSVVTKDGDITVMSPPAHSLAYKIRSIGGLRHRDKEKIQELDSVIDSKFHGRKFYEERHLSEWYNFRAMQMGSIAVELFENWLPDIYNGEKFTKTELYIYDKKRQLMAWADSKQWALDIAQGKGKLGKIARPILKMLNEEHD